ncbi:MAG: amidohydrolase family protein [Oscillospiraceae bacterium]|nr:amidohydrolase family protein [Oscillospiraceae bacterium]
MRIDVQCHIFPKILQEYMLDNPYPKCVKKGGVLICDFGSQILGLADESYEPANILRSMDAGKVDISIISPNIPDPGFLPPEKAAELCVKLNETTAEIAARSGGRFYGIGLLPWHAPEAAVREVAHIRELGLVGTMLFSRNAGLQVDDPALESVYGAVEKAGLPVEIHPTIPLWADPVGDYGMVAANSFVIDTAFAFMRLCYGGVMDRHPDMKVVMPHAGGVLPFLDGRLAPRRERIPEGESRNVKEVMFSGQAWYDLANHSPNVLRYFRDYLGLSRAMYATDYPFATHERATALQESMDFTAEERESINWRNADRLFGLGL